MKSGKINLIGAGPGDPGLFTIKGKCCWSKVEVVIYESSGRGGNPVLCFS
jgi:uroporphyrinogen III methyltransferase/synthase